MKVIKSFSSLIFLNEISFDLFFLGLSFSKIKVEFSKKFFFLNILKRIKLRLLEIFLSGFGFLFSTNKSKFKNCLETSFLTFTQNRRKWKTIKKVIKKYMHLYGFIFYKKHKMEPITVTIWEIFLKFFSLLPINFLICSNYGENLVESVQRNEFNFSGNYIKTIFFRQNFLYLIIKKYRNNFLPRIFQIFPENIYYFLGEEVFSNFFIILIRVCFTKTVNRNNAKINKNFQFVPVFINFKHQKFFQDLFSKRKIFYTINSLKLKKSKKLIKFYPNKSFKHSGGVLSNSFLQTMSIILEYRGLRFQKSFKNIIEKSNRNRKQDLYFFELNSFLTIDATFFGNQGRQLNHECKTNSFTRILKHSNKNSVFIISKKIVDVFEELCYDYKINIDDSDSDQIQCICFNFECKKELLL